MIGKPLPATLALAFLCLLAAACKTTPPASSLQPPAKPAETARTNASAAQPQEIAAGAPQAAAQEQQPPAQSQEPNATPVGLSSQRPGNKTAVGNPLTKIGSSVSAGVGGLIVRAETLLGIKPKPTRRSVPVQAPAARGGGAGIPAPDLLAVIVTAALILGGSGLSLAAIITGRRRAKVAST